MTEVSKSVCSNSVANFLSATRRRRAAVAALAGLAILSSSIQGANAAQATQVREVDDPGRIAYESQQSIGAGRDTFIFPVVPAGHRLVIQHISGEVFFQSIVSEVFVSAGSPEGGSNFLPLPSFTRNLTLFDQLVQLYVDAGHRPQVVVEANANIPVLNGFLTLTGYLLDCTVAPCATIAQ